jgi:hypothetical protein
MSDMQQEKLTPFTGVIKGEIVLPTIDTQKYIGKKVKIVSAVPVNTEFGVAVQVQTEIVETIAGGKGPIELRGSKLLSLHKNAEGELGWGATTKTGLFMAKYKAKKIADLVGQTVTLQTQAKKGSTVEYLTFN